MKIFLNIVHFQQNSNNYLNQLLSEYSRYPYQVDICIHTNKKIKNLNFNSYRNGKLKVKKHNLALRYFFFRNKNYYLTWAPRKHIFRNINNYDIFIYSEDDILIPSKAFEYWLRSKDILFEEKYIPGFILLERNKKGEDIAVGFKNEKLKNIVTVDEKKYLLNDNNRYMACWIYDKKMMEYWIESGFYDIRKLTTEKALRSEKLDKLNINSIWLRYLRYNFVNKKGYGIRENSAYGMNSISAGMIKGMLFPLLHNDVSEEAKIYHLPNSYADSGHKDLGNTKLKDII